MLHIRIRITLIRIQIRILNKAGSRTRPGSHPHLNEKPDSDQHQGHTDPQHGYSANYQHKINTHSWLCSCRPLRSVASSRESSSSYLWTPADPFTTADERCSPHTTILQHVGFRQGKYTVPSKVGSDTTFQVRYCLQKPYRKMSY